MQSHRQAARRRARTAQLVAGAGLAATLAIAVLPLHGALTRADQPKREVVQPPKVADEGPTDKPLDRAWVDRIFEGVGPAALPPVEAPPDKPIATLTPEPDPVPGDESDVPPSTRWQYLGSIASSRGRSALLRDTQQANRQHLVAEGRDVEGFTVRTVTASHVILADASGQQKVELAPVGKAWATPPSATAVRAAAAAQAQNRTNSRVNPAMANSRQNRPRAKVEGNPEVARQLREQLMEGHMDLDRLTALQKAGVIDDKTAEEIMMQYKEGQGLSEEEYAEYREKLDQ